MCTSSDEKYSTRFTRLEVSKDSFSQTLRIVILENNCGDRLANKTGGNGKSCASVAVVVAGSAIRGGKLNTRP